MQRPTILLLMFLCACKGGDHNTGAPAAVSDYNACISLVREVFQIECDHMRHSGKMITGRSTYDFRAEAFQEILKNPDRKLLQHYETLYQQIADAEYHMTDAEKASYQKEVDALYAGGCP
jgi:hypothetical protein